MKIRLWRRKKNIQLFIKQNRLDKIEGDRKRGRQQGRGQTEKERHTTRETETDKLRERQKERYKTDRQGFPGGGAVPTVSLFTA